jgi:alanyl-tRNA synthetase
VLARKKRKFIPEVSQILGFFFYFLDVISQILVILQVIDVVNEEEKQFLKTLGRGRRVFEKTIERSPPGTGVIPGNRGHLLDE